MEAKTTAVLLAAATLGIAVGGLVEVVRPGSALNRALLVTIVLIIVSMVAYRVARRRGGD